MLTSPNQRLTALARAPEPRAPGDPSRAEWPETELGLGGHREIDGDDGAGGQSAATPYAPTRARLGRCRRPTWASEATLPECECSATPPGDPQSRALPRDGPRSLPRPSHRLSHGYPSESPQGAPAIPSGAGRLPTRRRWPRAWQGAPSRVAAGGRESLGRAGPAVLTWPKLR